MVEVWESRLAGDQSDTTRRFDVVRELAAVRGLKYMDALKVADLPLKELMQRVKAVPVRGGMIDRIEFAAVLGGARMRHHGF